MLGMEQWQGLTAQFAHAADKARGARAAAAVAQPGAISQGSAALFCWCTAAAVCRPALFLRHNMHDRNVPVRPGCCPTLAALPLHCHCRCFCARPAQRAASMTYKIPDTSIARCVCLLLCPARCPLPSPVACCLLCAALCLLDSVRPLSAFCCLLSAVRRRHFATFAPPRAGRHCGARRSGRPARRSTRNPLPALFATLPRAPDRVCQLRIGGRMIMIPTALAAIAPAFLHTAVAAALTTWVQGWEFSWLLE